MVYPFDESLIHVISGKRMRLLPQTIRLQDTLRPATFRKCPPDIWLSAGCGLRNIGATYLPAIARTWSA